MDDQSGFEMLEKRVAWLDNERRNDKTNLASMLNRITELENDNKKLMQLVKDMDNELTGIRTRLGETKYDMKIERVTADLTKKVIDSHDKLDNSINENVKRLKYEIDTVNKSMVPLLNLPEAVSSTNTSIKNQAAEDTRLGKIIDEIKQKLDGVNRFDEDYKRSLYLIEDNLRQTNKRFTDVQGDVVAQRKRVEENRSRIDMAIDNIRQFDKRVAELQSYEKDRRESQSQFIDKVNMLNLERERTFKEWGIRIDEINKLDLGYENKMASLEKLQAMVEKSLQKVDDVTNRFERRINEISEIQRLNEDRFRQEWSTFKSDDQKHWTNYTLGQEEHQRENKHNLEKLISHVDILDTAITSIDDFLQQINKESLKQLQALLKLYQDALQSYSMIDHSTNKGS